MIDTCKAHSKDNKGCQNCTDDFSYGSSLLKENHQLTREILILNKKEQELNRKLTNLYGCIVSYQTGDVSKYDGLSAKYVEEKSLKDYFLGMKNASSIFSIITNKEIAISFLLKSGIYVPKTNCECGETVNLVIDSKNKGYAFSCIGCNRKYKFFDRSI